MEVARHGIREQGGARSRSQQQLLRLPSLPLLLPSTGVGSSE